MSRGKRNENIEIGWLSSTGSGSATLGRNIKRMVLEEGESMVVVPGDGFVYLLDPIGTRATAILDKHTAWIIGTYNGHSYTERIVEDLRDRAMELKASRSRRA